MRRLCLALVLLTSVSTHATIQSLKHGVSLPPAPTTVSLAPSIGGATYVLDAASEKAAYVFSASAAKAIRKVHFRTVVTTTGDTVDVRVETVDGAANGDPTGTLHTTDSNAAVVIANGDDNVWKSATLTADTAALTVGEVVAIVIVNGGGGGSWQIAQYSDQGAMLPYGDLFTSAWAKQLGPPVIVAEYSDGSFEPVFGYTDVGGPITTNTFKSDDATNRRGNIFQLAFPARAKGCWVWIDADSDYTCKLYDSDGSTVLATTATINAFQRQATGAGVQFLPFTTTASLLKATNYRIAIVPGTTSNLSAYDFDVPSAGMLDLFPGGQLMHRSVFTSSAWVETTTSRTYIGVILDGFDDGASGGRRRIIGG